MVLEVITVVATLGLLGVTGWYAHTTKRMADTAADAAKSSDRATESAERSATAAEKSAVAALEAARVAQSQVEVDFDGLLIAWTDPDPKVGTLASVRVRCLGAAVVVQRVHVRRAFLSDGLDYFEDEPAMVHVDLEALGEFTLPRRLHRHEFVHLSNAPMREAPRPFVRFILDVHYTFSEDGGAGGAKQLIVSQHSDSHTSGVHHVDDDDDL
ncbi:hypothetical protein [uncultured Nocardioides sp.]|uniref:hypothetical protein n=1 Tax=uncultured Nocardioides sp. TaxID=198441 RepID=UPI00263022FF|nr:hypothetical protein [uncultured Nocardioides sp.]